MSADFTIRQHDTKPLMVSTLFNPNGTPVNLTNATVAFSMRDQQTKLRVVSGAAVIVSAVNGVVSYTWGANDTSTAGWYNAVFIVTFNDGSSLTYPNNYFMTVLVTPSL
jgi:BppU N-terminal domain